MNIKGGGPAFPTEFVEYQPGEVGNSVPIMGRSSGMTLRDYFAAHAPTCPDDFRRRYATGGIIPEDPVEREVRWRQAYSDAMLKAREQQ